jgi:multiple antibiotic resistance protein
MLILSSTLNFFFLLTPFFVLLLFLDICKTKSLKDQHLIANKVAINILIICFTILFFGPKLFNMLGITLIAFQIGSGLILLLSGISMMSDSQVKTRNIESNDDPSLIPLTLPITVGPGTIGALFVLGSQLGKNLIHSIYSVIGIFLAVLLIWMLLRFSNKILKIIGHNGLRVLSKLTGLFLAILAIQSILNGVSSYISQFIKL